MKNHYLLLLLFIPFLSFSQTIVYSQDFESFNSNELLEPQSTEINGWWGDFTSSYVSTQFSNSGTNSAVFWTNANLGASNATSDAVLEFSDITSGMYELNFYVYQPSSTTNDPISPAGGYYNLLQQYDAVAGTATWAMEMYFMDQSQMDVLGYTGLLVAGGGVNITFNTIYDQWVEVKHEINLDDDIISVYYDGNLLNTWQYSLQASGGIGVAELAAIDLYAACAPQNISAVCSPETYFDDFALISYPVNINETKSINFNYYPNPSVGVINFEFNVDKSIESNITIFDTKGVSVSESNLMLEKGSNMHQYYINHLSKGIYFVKVSTKNGSVTKKIVVN